MWQPSVSCEVLQVEIIAVVFVQAEGLEVLEAMFVFSHMVAPTAAPQPLPLLFLGSCGVTGAQ